MGVALFPFLLLRADLPFQCVRVYVRARVRSCVRACALLCVRVSKQYP